MTTASSFACDASRAPRSSRRAVAFSQASSKRRATAAPWSPVKSPVMSPDESPGHGRERCHAATALPRALGAAVSSSDSTRSQRAVRAARFPGARALAVSASAARRKQAPGLVEDFIAGLSDRRAMSSLGSTSSCDVRPLRLDGMDLLGRAEGVARAGQTLDRETELELPRPSFLHADRGPIARARGQERPARWRTVLGAVRLSATVRSMLASVIRSSACSARSVRPSRRRCCAGSRRPRCARARRFGSSDPPRSGRRSRSTRSPAVRARAACRMASCAALIATAARLCSSRGRASAASGSGGAGDGRPRPGAPGNDARKRSGRTVRYCHQEARGPPSGSTAWYETSTDEDCAPSPLSAPGDTDGGGQARRHPSPACEAALARLSDEQSLAAVAMRAAHDAIRHAALARTAGDRVTARRRPERGGSDDPKRRARAHRGRRDPAQHRRR